MTVSESDVRALLEVFDLSEAEARQALAGGRCIVEVDEEGKPVAV